MRYRSTRRSAPEVPFSEALLQGLAPDGGLYVPCSFPRIAPGTLEGTESLAGAAPSVLGPFLENDRLAGDLDTLCREAFSFPTPLVFLPGDSGLGPTAVLELWHGPTSAFKDVGARFLAACLARIQGPDPAPRTVLVATSGDTGGAVAAALHHQPGIRVVVLYPEGGVSPRQEHQLTAWGDNVLSLRVRGVFDDCQRLLKAAFADPDLSRRYRLTTANSINIARLLPQIVPYAWASVRYRKERGRLPGFLVPSGNVGNSVGALWARETGFPSAGLVLVTNANRAIPEALEAGSIRPRPSVRTLASAMDVGNPSNLERLFDLVPDPARDPGRIQSFTVDDDGIRSTIADEARHGRVWDPHTATAIRARRELSGDWIVVSTAHPAKFETVVEPIVGRPVPVPPELREILDRPRQFRTIDPELDALRSEIDRVSGPGASR